MTTEDRQRGVYSKYRVERMDGSSAPGGKHGGCAYFVLDLNHDEHALAALRAYAESCDGEYPELAADLREVVSTRPCGCRGLGECFHFGPQTPNDAMSGKLAPPEEPDK